MSGFHDTVGLEVVSIGDGESTVRLEIADEHLNQGGTVHGGALATLVDTAMGAAVAGGAGDGQRPVTIDLRVSYMEPGRPGLIEATAKVRKRGSRITIVESEVVQVDSGEVVALASATFTTV
jgi:uncharacterized protein (TIGR00369 family)